MSKLTAKTKQLMQNSKLGGWIAGRFLLTWTTVSGFMAVFVTCPFCGRPGCVPGAGIYATVIAPILTFFSWKARKDQKRKKDTASEECAVHDSRNITERYIKSCRKDFWQKVFQLELVYLVEHLKGCRDVLSVGCGSAIIEGELAKCGFNVTGLDMSKEALNCAPDSVRTIAVRAEDMPFPASSFDAVLYIVSLQFIENFRKAIEKTTLVLRPDGKLIVMLLNPESSFFKGKLRDSNSYLYKIRHSGLREIEDALAENYWVQTEYSLGVKGDTIFASQEATEAVLYIIRGTRKPMKKDTKE